MYETAIDAVNDRLLFRPMTRNNADILISGSLSIGKSPAAARTFVPHNTHLTCFAGGMLAMGSKLFDRPDDLDIAIKLTDGCIWAANATATGIMPEELTIMPCNKREECHWSEETQAIWEKHRSHEHLMHGINSIKKAQYHLRPELIESIFYLYRITGDPKWRREGWRFFELIEEETETLYGNSAIEDVTTRGSNEAGHDGELLVG